MERVLAIEKVTGILEMVWLHLFGCGYNHVSVIQFLLSLKC